MEEFSKTNKSHVEEFDLDTLMKMQQMYHSSNKVSNNSLQWKVADEVTSSAATSAILEEIENDDFSTSTTSSNMYDNINMSEMNSYSTIEEKKKGKKNKKNKKT